MICLAAMLVMTACGKKDAAGAAAPSVTEQSTETTQEETASSTETTKPTETTEATKSTEETKPTETEPTKETEPSKATDKSKASEPSKATDKSKAVEPTKTTDKSKATEPSKAADNAGTKPSTPASTQANETKESPKESQAPAPTPAPAPAPAPEPAPAPTPAPHTHSMTTESVAATCGAAGHTKVYCTTCGYVESESTIPATGQHTWGPEVATGGSNCQDPKNAYQDCTGCGSRNSTAWNEPGPHVGATTTTKEPSCTEGGTWEEKCSLCGAMLGGGSIEPLDCVDNNGDRICDTCGRVL